MCLYLRLILSPTSPDQLFNRGFGVWTEKAGVSQKVEQGLKPVIVILIFFLFLFFFFFWTSVLVLSVTRIDAVPNSLPVLFCFVVCVDFKKYNVVCFFFSVFWVDPCQSTFHHKFRPLKI